MKALALLPGDGIGPEISEATRKIVDHSTARVNWQVIPTDNRKAEAIVGEVLEASGKCRAGLKGPISTRIVDGDRSVTVNLRQELDLYANVRPVKSLPGVGPNEPIDLVIVRENTEGLYSGLDFQIGEVCAQTIKLTTEKATRRIARWAFEYAAKQHRKEVNLVHKANVVKGADGMFVKIVREVSDLYPEISLQETIVDNLCMQLVQNPLQYEILLAPNLYGDIVSDLCAGLTGGLGLAPGANMGENWALFEAAHGSAPDIAGTNQANPIGLVRSAVMMLKYIDENVAAKQIERALHEVLAEGTALTPDLGGEATTSQVTDRIIDRMSSDGEC